MNSKQKQIIKRNSQAHFSTPRAQLVNHGGVSEEKKNGLMAKTRYQAANLE